MADKIVYSAAPELRWVNNELCWELLRGFSVFWVPDEPFTSIAFEIPQRFKTDFASLPGFIRAFNPVNGHHLQAAIVHDYVCRTSTLKVTKPEGDQMFYDGMIVMGTPSYRASYMYRGVRIFGGRFYVPRSY